MVENEEKLVICPKCHGDGVIAEEYDGDDGTEKVLWTQ